MCLYSTKLHTSTLMVDKVNMLTHAYPHKPLISNHQVDTPFYCSLMSVLVICQQTKGYGHAYWSFQNVFALDLGHFQHSDSK